MSVEEVCCKPRTVHTLLRYFDTLVTAIHGRLTCLDNLMVVLGYVENQTIFSVRSKNVCMIARNISGDSISES